MVRLEGVSNRRAAEGLWDVSYSCGLMSGPGWRTEGNTTASILLGLEVRLLHGGQPIGRVRDLLSAAVSRCYEVALDAGDGSRPVLVPFVDAIVPEVNVAPQGWLAIDPPPGLLDL